MNAELGCQTSACEGEMAPLPVLTRPSVVRSLINALDHRPGKGMGQNYLIDGNILSILLDEVEVEPGEAILEVGPGLGALTQALLRSGARVTAVEKDPVLAAHVRQMFPDLRLIQADVLKTDLNALFAGGIRKVAANLPYSVGSRFIVEVLESSPLPERMVFMVQKEVADRLCAGPGGKTYGPLAIWSQLCYQVRTVKIVRPVCFMPVPKVDSAVVRFDMRPAPLAEPVDEQRFRALVKSCFTRRRKQLGTILRKTDPRAAARLGELGIDPTLRPEQLPIEKWVALAG